VKTKHRSILVAEEMYSSDLVSGTIHFL